MPKLMLDGDARGAVNATAAVQKGFKGIGDEAKKTGAITEAADAKNAESLKRQQAETDKLIAQSRRFNREVARQLQEERLARDQVTAGVLRHQAAAKRLAGELAKTSTAQHAMGAFLTRWAGPAVLFTGAIQGLRQYVTEIDTLIEKVRMQSAGLGSLAQFAITEKEPERVFGEYTAEAVGAIGSGAVPSRDLNQAAGMIAALVGANLNKRDRDFLIKLQSSAVVEDVSKLAPSIAAFQSSFPQLSAEQLVGKGLATAKLGSSRLDELIKEVGVAAPAAKQLGFSPDFVLAAGSVLDRAMASASEGATRLESFMRQFERFGLQKFPQLAGQDPISVLRFIEQRGLDRTSIEEFVGNRAEAIQGVRLMISNLPQLEQLMRDSVAAESQRLATRFADLPRTVPFLAASEAGRIASGAREAATLNLTTVPGVLDAIFESEIARRRTERPGFMTEFQNFFTGISQSIAPLLPERLQRMSINAQLGQTVEDPRLRQAAEQALRGEDERQTKALESIDRKTRSVPVASGRQQ